MANKNQEFTTRKLTVGEVVQFEDVALTKMETRFGESTIVNFADASGEVVRDCFAQGGMLEWLKNNPSARSIVLKKQLKKGDLTFNVWSEK